MSERRKEGNRRREGGRGRKGIDKKRDFPLVAPQINRHTSFPHQEVRTIRMEEPARVDCHNDKF
jgi:hypothetical protein